MMKLFTDRWKFSQENEAECWNKNRLKLNSEEYKSLKTQYWKKLFEIISSYLKLDDSQSWLDFGCGPSGIVLAYPDRKKLVCLDPLMNFYLENFPYLKEYEAEYVNGEIETVKSKTYDVIFGFNAIDHVDNIQQAAVNLKELLTSEGRIILTINAHDSKIIQQILLQTSFLFDPLHPHQYTKEQYKDLFTKAGLEVENIVDINEPVRWINEQTKSKGPTGFKLKNLIKPSWWFFSLVKLVTGRERYGNSTDKTVFKHYMFVCKLPA